MFKVRGRSRWSNGDTIAVYWALRDDTAPEGVSFGEGPATLFTLLEANQACAALSGSMPQLDWEVRNA